MVLGANCRQIFLIGVAYRNGGDLMVGTIRYVSLEDMRPRGPTLPGTRA